MGPGRPRWGSICWPVLEDPLRRRHEPGSGSARADSWRTLDRALARLWERSAMQDNRWHSPWILWYPDVMRLGARWLVRLPHGTEAAEQRPTGV
jgi:hypothetical protein